MYRLYFPPVFCLSYRSHQPANSLVRAGTTSFTTEPKRRTPKFLPLSRHSFTNTPPQLLSQNAVTSRPRTPRLSLFNTTQSSLSHCHVSSSSQAMYLFYSPSISSDIGSCHASGKWISSSLPVGTTSVGEGVGVGFAPASFEYS